MLPFMKRKPSLSTGPPMSPESPNKVMTYQTFQRNTNSNPDLTNTSLSVVTRVPRVERKSLSYSKIMGNVPALINFLRDCNPLYVKQCFDVYSFGQAEIFTLDRPEETARKKMEGFLYSFNILARKKRRHTKKGNMLRYSEISSAPRPQGRSMHTSIASGGSTNYGKKKNKKITLAQLKDFFASREIPTLCLGLLKIIQEVNVFTSLPIVSQDKLDIHYCTSWMQKLGYSRARLIGHLCCFFKDIGVEGNFDTRFGFPESVSYFIQYSYSIFPHQATMGQSGNGLRRERPESLLYFVQLEYELLDFFESLDRSYCCIAFRLVRLYEISSLCLGIVNKFKALPFAWKARLMTLKHAPKWANKSNFDKILFLEPGAQVPLKLPTAQIPREMGYEFMLLKRRAQEDKRTMILQEFENFQVKFFTLLNRFAKDYVSEIEFILTGHLGEVSKNALGISMDQLETLMGKHLRDLITVEGNWLKQMSILTTLPDSTGLNEGESKILLLCNLFFENVPSLNLAFANYVVNFKANSAVLEHLMRVCNSRPRSETNNGAPENFVQIFEQYRDTLSKFGHPTISSENSRPQMPDLDSLLASPINHIPKLGLFFQRLQKLEHPSSPEYEALDQAEKSFRQLMNTMDLYIEEVKAQTENQKARLVKNVSKSGYKFSRIFSKSGNG